MNRGKSQKSLKFVEIRRTLWKIVENRRKCILLCPLLGLRSSPMHNNGHDNRYDNMLNNWHNDKHNNKMMIL